MSEELDIGRAAFARREWAATHAALAGRPLAAEDLELLAVAAYLLGRDDESTGAWEAAHRAWLESGDVDRAAWCACWLALTHLLRGEVSIGTGWLARAERMIAEAEDACPAHGLALVVSVLTALDEGDSVTAAAVAEEIVAIGRRFDDCDVLAFGLLTCGEAAIAAGDLARGVRLFDEVMVALGADEVSPVTAGIVYCAVIEGCMLAFDLQRAAEWTEALRRWCAEQSDLVPYRGQCLVHRSQLLQARGEWSAAEAEADRARRLLSDPDHPALAVAVYQRGELHRVRGELDAAERAFRTASTLGYDPVPGLALLRLSQGRIRDAVADLDGVLGHRRSTMRTPTGLAAAVEVFLAAGDVERARAAAAELGEVAARVDAPMLLAAAALATGRVRLAEGDAANALVPLCEARDRSRELDLVYETARARIAIATASRALGDHETADAELDTAIRALDDLGARVDLARARSLQRPALEPRDRLTARECDVLRLVAGGGTNREIASSLQISEHTVARHLQNIFTKLGLSSRAAATAYAYECGLIGARGQN